MLAITVSRGASMTEYRLYLLDERGRITWGAWIEAADLESAIASVKEKHDCTCEIWQGQTCLAIVPAKVRQCAASARQAET